MSHNIDNPQFNQSERVQSVSNFSRLLLALRLSRSKVQKNIVCAQQTKQGNLKLFCFNLLMSVFKI